MPKPLTNSQRGMIPPQTEMGPAMRALPERWQVFVMAMVMQGDKVNQTEAARIAGYSGAPDVVKVTGHHLAHDSRIQAAIHEMAVRRVRASTLMATAVLEKIAADDEAENKDRIKAAEMLLNRGGLPSRTISEQHVTVTVTKEQQIQEVLQLARVLGLEPKKLLGSMADVSDAEIKAFEESTGTKLAPEGEAVVVEPVHGEVEPGAGAAAVEEQAAIGVTGPDGARRVPGFNPDGTEARPGEVVDVGQTYRGVDRTPGDWGDEPL